MLTLSSYAAGSGGGVLSVTSYSCVDDTLYGQVVFTSPCDVADRLRAGCQETLDALPLRLVLPLGLRARLPSAPGDRKILSSVQASNLIPRTKLVRSSTLEAVKFD